MDKENSSTALLEKKGWTRCFIACEPRLSEAIDMYKQAGFDIHLESLSKELDCKKCPGENLENECQICFEGFEYQYKVIFTRPGKNKEKEDK